MKYISVEFADGFIAGVLLIKVDFFSNHFRSNLALISFVSRLVLKSLIESVLCDVKQCK